MSDKTSKQQRARSQADAQFSRPAQSDKDSAMAEYRAQAQVMRDKTERLRALRLAKEAADEQAASEKKRTTAIKKRASAASKTAKTAKAAKSAGKRSAPSVERN